MSLIVRQYPINKYVILIYTTLKNAIDAVENLIFFSEFCAVLTRIEL